LTFVSPNKDYFDIDILTEYYQEEPRMKARRSDQKQSPLEFWNSSKNTMIFDKVISRGEDFNTYNLREALYAVVKECTQFKCTLMRAVIQKFNSKRVLDFSAGWGDRLLGAIACNVDLYVGVDPNLDLKAGHDAIIGQYTTDENRDNFKIIYEPFQNCTLPEDATFDLVFTSPPFFSFEHYTSMKGQSILDFPKFEDWAVFFSVGFSQKILG